VFTGIIERASPLAALTDRPGGKRLTIALGSPASPDPSRQDPWGGLEIGAIPLGTAISDFAYTASPSRILRTFVVRKQAKDHGLGKRIEGATQPGDHGLIVDDVLTSGGSLIKAVHAAREAELTVTHALVIVDREEQDGKRSVEQEGVTLIRLLTLEDLKAAKPQ